MGLKIAQVYKGIPITNAYHKITQVGITETKDGTDKEYQVRLTLKSYTDDTKEFEIEERKYYFQNIKDNKLSFNEYYKLIKTEAKFEGAIDSI